MIFSDETEEKDVSQDDKKVLFKIMGKEATIDAKFKVEDSIMIDCEVKGELDVDGEIFIDTNGEVDANIKTKDAFVKGKYKGNLEAENDVEIDASGEVSGKIKTDSFIINRGAVFDGKVTRLTKKK